jgi:anti-anti-sigma factor
MLDIKLDNPGGYALCTLQGRLDSNTAADFEGQLLRDGALHTGVPLVLDCSGLEYVSSAGLRVILLLVRKAAPLGVALGFAGLRSNVRSVLEISGMLGMLKTHESVEAAAAALKA